MSSEVHKSAVATIQRLWNVSLLVLVVWFLLAPDALEQMKRYQAALDLTAWRLLTTFAATLPTAESEQFLRVGYAPRRPRSGFVGPPPPAYRHPLLGLQCADVRGDSDDDPPSESCEPLVVQANWPRRRQVVIFLSTEHLQRDDEFDGGRWMPTRFSGLTHFRVVANAGVLPLNSYVISRVRGANSDEYVVHHLDDDWTKTVLAEWPTRKILPYGRPRRDADIRTYLGVNDADSITNEQLAVFQTSAALSGMSLRFPGLDVDASRGFGGVGILLSAIAFLMVGPLLVLREPVMQHEIAWTLLVNTTNRPVLETVISLLMWAWSLAPLVVALAQLFTGAPVPAEHRLFAAAGAFGLAFASGVFVWCNLILRRLRRAIAAA